MSDFKKRDWKQEMLTGPVLEWLLDSNPAVRWQVMRDLLHEPEDKVAAVRSQVAVEGWGQQILAAAAQDLGLINGHGNLYSYGMRQ